MTPLLVSSGEPAGVGPDLCIALAQYGFPIVVLGDLRVLQERAALLKEEIEFVPYELESPCAIRPGALSVLHVPCPSSVSCGQLNVTNAPYVIELLTRSADLCNKGLFSGLITAPVHKAIINQAGIEFTGHTEFFARFFKVPRVVMLLACKEMKVALMTTHLPLKEVPKAIDYSLIVDVILQLNQTLINDFGISAPKIKVAGLNPHAGESGYLGREEIDVITPALKYLKKQGIQVEGPLPADTLFILKPDEVCDAFVTMYHDQGLPVLKYVGFNHAVNITLGLPIIRTSVDHGTALDLAGTGKAHPGSMIAAVELAITMNENRIKNASN